MDDRLVLFVATVAQISKLSTLCRLLSRIFPPTDLHKENERSFGKFYFITNKYKIWIADKDCGPWTESDRLGYATVRLTGSPIARDLAKTQHGVYREYKNRTRINSIGTSPSETTRLSVEGTTYNNHQPPRKIQQPPQKHLQPPTNNRMQS